MEVLMFTTIKSSFNTENTQLYPENHNSSSCVPVTVNQYLIAEEPDYSTPNSESDSWSVVDIADHNSNISHENEYSTTQDTNYESIVKKAQNELEDALFTKNHDIAKQTMSLLINNPVYPNLFIDILNNLLIQNKTTHIKTIFFEHKTYNTDTLNYLLQDQLNREQNIMLIKKLVAKGASLTIEDVELLLQSNDHTLKNKQLNLLYYSDLLHSLLNEAVDQDRLDIIANIYYMHNFATTKSLNYLLEDLFTYEFDLISFNQLITDGATIKTSTLQKLIASEDIDKIGKIINSLVSHNLYNTILTSILTIAIDQNKTSIVKMLDEYYNFYTNASLNYLLLKNLQDITDIDYINELIESGATITNKEMHELLTVYALQLTNDQFLEFYPKLEQINFSEETKKAIKLFWQ
jgi:hypothetical protein